MRLVGFLPLATALVLGACGSRGSNVDAAAISPRITQVEVTNDNDLDMHVFVVTVGQTISLGLVQSFQETTFDLPEWTAGTIRDLRFLADPIGANMAYLSDPILFNHGDLIQLRIGPNLRLSYVAVFPR